MTYAAAVMMIDPQAKVINRLEASIFNLYDREIKLTPDTKIKDLEVWGSSEYELDSLDKLEWTMEIEDHFNIDLLLKDIVLPETIGELADIILSIIAEQTE